MMKRSLFYVFLSAFVLLLFSWCSMMPDDEEIIKWSILENEIFWNNLDDEVIENVEVDDENESSDIENQNEDDIEEDSSELIELEIQWVE